jgi:ABC-type antimicrobial peptide transport system, ATPase component
MRSPDNTAAGLPVRCVGLRHVYRVAAEDLVALHGLELAVEAGTTVAVVGPSGSGKSTLLTVLAGLQQPTSGQVWMGDTDLAALRERALLRIRAERVGVVVQDPARNLLPFADAVDNIRFAQRGPAGYGRRALPEPIRLLTDLGLAELAGTAVRRLSGGERQRLALAVGMAGRPGVLLADEPTSQLDTANRDRVVELLQRINARYGTTVLAVTHDPDVAVAMSRQIVLHEGRIAGEAA